MALRGANGRLNCLIDRRIRHVAHHGKDQHGGRSETPDDVLVHGNASSNSGILAWLRPARELDDTVVRLARRVNASEHIGRKRWRRVNLPDRLEQRQQLLEFAGTSAN
jgi:hypothetical protein